VDKKIRTLTFFPKSNSPTNFEVKFSSKLRFSSKFSFCLPPTPKPHIVLNVENNNKDQTWRNRATPLDRTRKFFPNEPTNSTPNVPSQPPPTTKAKNQVKNHTQKHKHTKKKNERLKIR